MVCVDEVHLLSDSYRGHVLELLLSKVRYMDLQKRKSQSQTPGGTQSETVNGVQSAPSPFCPIQIVCLSATISDVSLLQRAIDASLYIDTSFRPVLLHEYIVQATGERGREVRERNGKKKRSLVCGPLSLSLKKMIDSSDPDGISLLVSESVANNQSVLVFCPSHSSCRNVAVMVARFLSPLVEMRRKLRAKKRERERKNLSEEEREREREKDRKEERERQERILQRQALVNELLSLPLSPDESLLSLLLQGIGIHHAGLTVEERERIERAYRFGSLSVLFATTTLAAGVNLPAQRVILRSLELGGMPMDVMKYKQMVGRAGRMGHCEEEGESYCIVKRVRKKERETEREKGEREKREREILLTSLSLVNRSIPPLRSCLEALLPPLSPSPSPSPSLSSSSSSSSSSSPSPSSSSSLSSSLSLSFDSFEDPTSLSHHLCQILMDMFGCGLLRTGDDLKLYLSCSLIGQSASLSLSSSSSPSSSSLPLSSPSASSLPLSSSSSPSPSSSPSSSSSTSLSLSRYNHLRSIVKLCLRYLLLHHFLSYSPQTRIYTVSQLGHASMCSSLSPRLCLSLCHSLSLSRSKLHVHDLHLLYLLVPFDSYPEPNWKKYERMIGETDEREREREKGRERRNERERESDLFVLGEIEREIAKTVGVSPTFLKVKSGFLLTSPPLPRERKREKARESEEEKREKEKEKEKGKEKEREEEKEKERKREKEREREREEELIHIRFWNALVCYRLLSGISLSQISSEFGMSRGAIQNLQR